MSDTNRMITANKLLNDTAVEVGLNPVQDPYASTDPIFQQMVYLLNSAGQELVSMYEWSFLVGSAEVITDSTTNPDGKYPLPDDFSYMIDQTGWDRDRRLPMQGPLTPQQWTYLEGRNLASSTIYATFRLVDNQVWIYPTPPPDGLRITYEYIKRTWVMYGSSPTIGYRDEVQAGSDLIMFEPILMKRWLKLKWKAAKGFDTSGEASEFGLAFDSWTGKSSGAEVLNGAGSRRGYPFLNVWRNLGDTGFGL